MKKLVIENYPFTLNVFKPIYEPFHAINSLDVIYIVEGSLKIKTIRKYRKLKKGELEFINVGELISCEKKSKNTLVARLSIDIEFIKQVIPDINNRVFNCKMNSFYNGRSSEESYEELKIKTLSIIAGMFFHSFSTEKNTIIANKLLKFFQNEFEDIKNALKNVDKTIHQERFIRIDHYLMANITRQISLNDINDIEFISKPYLSKEFARLLNRNFKEILSYYRVIHASKLLLDTNLSIFEISLESGFSGTRYFYKYFKIFLDMTPNDFRNLHRNKSFKYEKILEHEKNLIKNAISKLTGQILYLEKIVINKWIPTNTDTSGIELSFELNVIVKHLKQKFYLYNLLKIVEKISIRTCRFIFSPPDISEFSISDIYEILKFIFKNFNSHFSACLSLDFSSISDATDYKLLEIWIKKTVKLSKQIDTDIRFNILIDSKDIKRDLELLYPKLQIILKSSIFRENSDMNLSDLSSYIKDAINSKINIFITPKDVSLIKTNPDTAILLFNNQFIKTSYFNLIYMFSLLNGNILNKNNSVISSNYSGDYAIFSINSSGYKCLLYNLDNVNQKTIKIIIKTDKRCGVDHSIFNFNSDTKNNTQTLLYQKTNIFSYEKLFSEYNITTSSFLKKGMDVNIYTVANETFSNGNQIFVVTLEPGDIIVLNIPKDY
jgi:AraC-like DNA-binding protein